MSISLRQHRDSSLGDRHVRPDQRLAEALELIERLTVRCARYESWLAAFDEHAPFEVWVKDSQGRYSFVNRAFETCVGRSRGEMLGRCADELFDGDTAGRIREIDRSVMADGPVHRVIECSATGTARTIDELRVPVRDRSGRVNGVACFAFDITPDAADRPVEPTADPVPTDRPPRILLVEDRRDNQLVAIAHLAGAGYLVDVAATGADALAQSEADAYAVVLMDLQLPDASGLDVARKLKAASRGRSLPVIAVTANALPGTRERCLDAGMVAYFAKPVDWDRLLLLLSELVAARAAAAAART